MDTELRNILLAVIYGLVWGGLTVLIISLILGILKQNYLQRWAIMVGAAIGIIVFLDRI